MKRRVTWLVAGLAISMTPANADVYVKVDAQGNAIGGAIMCDAATCGAGSQYSQLTLQEGERYVLQGVGVDYGIGNNNPDTRVQHDDRSNEWVVTRDSGSGNAPDVERFEVFTPAPTPSVPAPIIETPTAIDTRTAILDSTTAIDTATALLFGDFADYADFPWWVEFLKMLAAWLATFNWL